MRKLMILTEDLGDFDPAWRDGRCATGDVLSNSPPACASSGVSVEATSSQLHRRATVTG